MLITAERDGYFGLRAKPTLRYAVKNCDRKDDGIRNARHKEV